MRNVLLVLLFSGCVAARPAAVMTQAAPLDHATSIEQVRQAEIAFAKSFADKNPAAFQSLLAPGVVFVGPSRTLHGGSEVMDVWSKLIEENKFSWAPERVEVNADGTLGLSMGPVKDRAGNVFANYSSIWQRQSDGSWKIVFDGPGCSLK